MNGHSSCSNNQIFFCWQYLSNQGIIDRVDFNATTHGQRDLEDNRLSNLIEAVSMKSAGVEIVEELEALETEATEVNGQLKSILDKLGVGRTTRIGYKQEFSSCDDGSGGPKGG